MKTILAILIWLFLPVFVLLGLIVEGWEGLQERRKNMDWSKLSSGKFLLTLICGFVFAYVSIRKIIPPDAVVPILAMVFISYFQKNPEPNQGETTTQVTENKTTEVKNG